jgi:hypothetical protein
MHLCIGQLGNNRLIDFLPWRSAVAQRPLLYLFPELDVPLHHELILLGLEP